MTLAECLNEIKNVYLHGSREAITKIGMGLLKEIKLKYFPDEPYPKDGWLLMIDPDGPPTIVHPEGVRMKVNLRPRTMEFLDSQITKPKESELDKNTVKMLRMSYADKVMQMRKEKYLREIQGLD